MASEVLEVEVSAAAVLAETGNSFKINLMNKYLILVGWLSFFIVNSVNAQLIKTTLQITVRNGLGNIEPGAKVSLYATKDDY